jgi:hypothetical protein
MQVSGKVNHPVSAEEMKATLQHAATLGLIPSTGGQVDRVLHNLERQHAHAWSIDHFVSYVMDLLTADTVEAHMRLNLRTDHSR